MNRLLIFACLGALLAISSTAFAELETESSKIKAIYDETVSKQKDLLKSAIERKLAEATRDGNLDTVTTLQEELSQFDQMGVIPKAESLKSSTQKYVKAVEAARDRAKTGLDKRVRTLTKAGRIDEATETRSVLDSLLTSESPAAGPDGPVGPLNESVQVVEATWKHLSLDEQPVGREVDVLKIVKPALESKGGIPIVRNVLGAVDGGPVPFVLCLKLDVLRARYFLELREGSSILLSLATEDDLKREGTSVGSTKLELIDITSETFRSARETIPATRAHVGEEVVPVLRTQFVKVETPLFRKPLNDAERLMHGVFRFRYGKQVLEIRAVEGSRIVIPMSDAVVYRAPWDADPGGAITPVKVIQAVWKGDGRNGPPGKETKDIRNYIQSKIIAGENAVFDVIELGKLNRSRSGFSAFVTLSVNGLTVESQLTEGSYLALQDPKSDDLRNSYTQLGLTPIRLLGVGYSTTDLTKSIETPEMSRALLSGPIEVNAPLFPDFAFGKTKLAIIQFKVGEKVLKIAARESSKLRLVYE